MSSDLRSKGTSIKVHLLGLMGAEVSPSPALGIDIPSVDVRGGPVAKDDSPAPKSLALPKEEERP